MIYLDNVKPGQQLQVLTKDGRQLIGSEMSIDEKYQLLTKENGFTDPVTFSDAYLNQVGRLMVTCIPMCFTVPKAAWCMHQQFDRLGQPMAPTPTPCQTRNCPYSANCKQGQPPV